jgi:hypothetical protein
VSLHGSEGRASLETMKPVVLKAHFDGREIKLDEPYDLPVNARLAVTILPAGTEDADWRALSLASLARAYGDDEPDYPLGMVAEPCSE